MVRRCLFLAGCPHRGGLPHGRAPPQRFRCRCFNHGLSACRCGLLLRGGLRFSHANLSLRIRGCFGRRLRREFESGLGAGELGFVRVQFSGGGRLLPLPPVLASPAPPPPSAPPLTPPITPHLLACPAGLPLP